MKKAIAVAVVFVVLAGAAPFTYNAIAGSTGITGCTNARVIYAFDSNTSPLGHNADMTIYDRNGSLLASASKSGGDNATVPDNVYISVNNGERLAYQGENDGSRISYQILDANKNLVEQVSYASKIGTAFKTISQNGYVSFTAGTSVHAHNLLLLCSASGNTTPPPVATNQPPTWSQTSNQTAYVNQTLQFTVFASDPNGDAITYSAFNMPSGASFSNRTLSWTPNSNQTGNYTVTFRASDGTLYSDMSVTITVNSSGGGCTYNCGGNQAPVWNQTGSQTAYVNQSLQFYVSAYDPNGDSLSYSAYNIPSGASFDSGSRRFSWTPNSNQTGYYAAIFRVSDGHTSVDMNVQIMVNGSNNYDCNYYNNCYNNSNQAPYWNQTPDQVAYVNQNLQFSVTAYDSNYDSLSYSAYNLPSGAYFNSYSRIFSWTPSSNQVGTYTVTFRVSDGRSSTADMNVRITVYGSYNYNYYNYDYSQTPTFQNFNPPLVAVVGQLYTYTVQAYSGYGSAITYRLINAPSGMTIDRNYGIISMVPTSGQIGSHTVTIGASNGQYEATRSYDLSILRSTGGVVTTTNGGGTVRVVTTVAEAKLVISDIRVKQDDGDILITWKTNKPAHSRVIYDTDPQADSATNNYSYNNATRDPGEDELNTEHEVRLDKKDLEDGETYYFRAVSKAGNELVVSGEKSFVYFAKNQNSLLLGLISSLGDFFGNPWFWIILLLLIIGLLVYRLTKRPPTYVPMAPTQPQQPQYHPQAYTSPRLEPNPNGAEQSKTMFML